MQGRKIVADEKVLLFRLSAQVPEHHFYRQVKQRLEPGLPYDLTAPSKL
jgi:hypothetical protein